MKTIIRLKTGETIRVACGYDQVQGAMQNACPPHGGWASIEPDGFLIPVTNISFIRRVEDGE